MPGLLLDATTLKQRLSLQTWLVLDVRHALADPAAGYQQFLQGHIPGAVFLSQDTDLAGALTGHNGRHPLPDPSVLSQQLMDAGLTSTTDVIIYDEGGGMFAARAWWLLRWLGHEKVSLLDGGWQAWQDAGGPQESGQGSGPHVTRNLPAAAWIPGTAPGGHMPALDAAATDRLKGQSGWLLLDARDAVRYRGEQEPIDPVAGHIPDALNRPAGANLTPAGCFKSPEALRQQFSDQIGDVDPAQVVHYCGSGIFACHNLFAMELAGLSGSQLYPGSWSEWCSDPQRAVATV